MSDAATLVQSLRDFAGECAADYDDIKSGMVPLDVETLATILAAIRDARADLALFYASVEKDLIRTAGTKRFVVDGLGEVAIRKNTKRSGWDNHALTAVVVARALDERQLDEDTGEYEPEGQAVARVLTECARPSWRVTPLRERGIDETEYCTVEPNGWAVQLPPRST